MAEKKKLNRKQQDAIEQQLVKDGTISARTRNQSRSFLWNLCAVLLAFFFGVFACLGGLLGAGYFAATKTSVKDVLQAFGVDSSQYLEEAYAEMSLLELVQDLSSTQFDRLSGISKYTPLLESELEKLNEQLSPLGISINVEELIEVPFSELGSYLQNDVLGEIEIGAALGVSPSSSAIMLALCYGKEGVDYELVTGEDGTAEISMLEGKEPLKVGDLKGAAVTERVNGIELAAVIGLDPESASPLMMAICYGTEGVDYTLVDEGGTVSVEMLGDAAPTTVGTLSEGDSMQTLLNKLELGALLDLDASSDAMLLSLCYGEEGVDYELDGSRIVPYRNGTGESSVSYPVTVGLLTSSASDVLGEIEIETVLQTNASSEPSLRYLAYGSEGKQYEIVEADGALTIQMLPRRNEAGEIVYEEDGVTPVLYEKRKIADLTAEDASLFGEATVGDLVAIDENSSDLMRSLRDWTIADLTNGEKVEALKIGQLMSIGQTSSRLLLAIADWTIADLKQQEKIESLRIGDVIEADASSSLLSAIADWTLGDLSDQSRIERLKIGQLIETDGSLLMQAIADWRIGELGDQAKIDSLVLGDVIDLGTDPLPILSSLAQTPIGDLNERVSELRLCDILDMSTLEEGNILLQLQDSTLDTMADDIQNLSAEQVFGEEMYTYLRLSAYEGKTHAQLVEEYRALMQTENSPEKEAASEILPQAIPDGAVITEKRVAASAENARTASALSEGWFVESGTGYRLTDGDVYAAVTKTADGTQKSYYLYETVRLTSGSAWRVLGAGGALTQLPAGDAVSADTAGSAAGETPSAAGKTPATDESGAPLYYLAASADGTAGSVYYPLYEDAYSVYFLRVENGGTVRTDLERVVTSYTAGEETVAPNGDGTITLASGTYRVRTDAEGDYVLVKRTAMRFFYAPQAGQTQFAAEELYEESETIVRYYGTWTEGSVTYTEEELDRYLDGVWYLLFDTGTGDTHMPVFEIADRVRNVADQLNTIVLWEMYLHGLLEENPYCELPVPYGTCTNLNELNVADAVKYVKTLAPLLQSAGI